MLPSVKVFKDPNSGVSHPTTTLSFPTMLSRCRLILLRRVYFRNQFRNQFRYVCQLVKLFIKSFSYLRKLLITGLSEWVSNQIGDCTLQYNELDDDDDEDDDDSSQSSQRYMIGNILNIVHLLLKVLLDQLVGNSEFVGGIAIVLYGDSHGNSRKISNCFFWLMSKIQKK
ncbi:unnamed protein product [Rhizophagus irregularis]|nr:unnamed protein product [Rhizophagus irregularis]